MELLIRVCAVVGYHLAIQTLIKKEGRNVRSFYSGHYKSYGVNAQGACDHLCRFVFLGMAGPGVLPDRDAVDIVHLTGSVLSATVPTQHQLTCVLSSAEPRQE